MCLLILNCLSDRSLAHGSFVDLLFSWKLFNNTQKLDVLTAKAERGLSPVSERERERQREKETERDSLIYAGTVMTVNMLIKLWSVLKRCHFYFFHD